MINVLLPIYSKHFLSELFGYFGNFLKNLIIFENGLFLFIFLTLKSPLKSNLRNNAQQPFADNLDTNRINSIAIYP